MARPQLAVMHLCLGGALLPPRRLEASSGALSGFGSAGGRGVGGDGGVASRRVDAKASTAHGTRPSAASARASHAEDKPCSFIVWAVGKVVRLA